MNELWRGLDELKRYGSNEDWRGVFARLPRRVPEVYQAYIGSNAWKHKREHRKNLDCYKCNQCPRVNNLTVHHITYERLGDELMEDLITLCGHCHHTHHGLDRSIETQFTQALFSTKRGGVLTRLRERIEAQELKTKLAGMA